MIKRTRSTPRPKLESAPSKSESLPPLNLQSPVKKTQNQLVVNNYILHNKNRSFDHSFEPQAEIEALHKLCNELLRGQEELKQRLNQQEAIIDQLKVQGKVVQGKRDTGEMSQPRRVETLTRRLPAFTPRGSEESGFFTFRPAEKEKQKFPREIFSRKSRVRPNVDLPI
jgi:hypothetical protein